MVGGVSDSTIFRPHTQVIMSALPHVMQQGTGWITAEFERIGRLITDRQASSKQVVEYHMRQKLYRSFFSEPIPKVVHFIKTDGDPSNFNIIHYISVRSASWHIKPTTIFPRSLQSVRQILLLRATILHLGSDDI